MITMFDDLPGVQVRHGPLVRNDEFSVGLAFDHTTEGLEALRRVRLVASLMLPAFGGVWMETHSGPDEETPMLALVVRSCSMESFLRALSDMPSPSLPGLIPDGPVWAEEKLPTDAGEGDR